MHPLAVRHIRQPPLLRTGTSALVGRRSALVIEEVTAHDGRVRIGGEVCSARAGNIERFGRYRKTWSRG